LVQQLSSEVDLGHDEGRAKLKDLAVPLFARMPDGIYRERYWNGCPRHVGMPAAALKKRMRRRGGTTGGRSGAGGGGTRTGCRPQWFRGSRLSRPRLCRRGNLLSQAITLVVHHPAAARLVRNAEALGSVNAGRARVEGAAGTGLGHANPSTAMLLERWRDRPEYARLSELAMAEPMVAEAQAAARSCRWRLKSCWKSMVPAAEWTNYSEKPRNWA